jgi:protease I
MASQKRIAILVEDFYQVLEVWYPFYRLQEEGFKVLVIGSGTKSQYASKEGYPIEVDASIGEVKSKDFDAVIIPGGWAPDFLRRHEKIVKFVRDLYERKRIVASICHGGWLLVSAGILKGKKATSFFAIKDDLIAAGALFQDKDVVVDHPLITSRKPDDLPRFVQEIIKKLRT